jgi:glycosyltransferase involved in cell wall biosynthesis
VTSSSQAAPDSKQPPLVSIVIATYNRPTVLAFAIRSVLAQDFADWELIVVGDRCAEPTAELMASFADQRIRYMNLALNWGDQSGPNNIGIARAQGRYIAFLNHDDLWFPDHLRSAMDWLEASGADGVIARSAYIRLRGTSERQDKDWYSELTGIGRKGRYDPLHTHAPASTWLLKSSAARAAGPWRAASDCFSASSQEWLFRLWKCGFDVRTMPHLTVMQFPSARERPGSYTRSDTAEHAFFESRLSEPRQLRLALLDRYEAPAARPLWRRLAKRTAFACLRLAAHLGLAPSELLGRFFLRYRRGAFIDILRKARGLSSLPDREPSAGELRARYAAEESDTGKNAGG